MGVTLGRTAVTVSPVGLGCAPIANLYASVTADQATATVRAAYDAGVRYFDTAPHYGSGLSETRLGAALRDAAIPRAEVTISTKVGRVLVANEPGYDDPMWEDVPDMHSEFDFSADGVKRSLDASLERLGVDRVDIALVHDPDEFHDQARDETIPLLCQWRDEGVIGAVGVGMNHSEPLSAFVRETDIDCVLQAGQITLLDRRGLDELAPLCEDRGVSIIAAAVFNSGVLADPTPESTYFYGKVPQPILERAQKMQSMCRSYGVELAQAAAQYPARQPAVATVLVGCRSPEEIEANAAASDLDLPDSLWEELEAL